MIGISTACLYPVEPEKSLKELAERGVKLVEVFLNTESEFTVEYIKKFRTLCDYYGITINSVHPYTSFAESFYFFNKYDRRQEDSFELYKHFYERTLMLGAKIFNFHGEKKERSTTPEQYAEIFSRIYEDGRRAGLTVSQENVCRCKCGSLEYITRLSDLLGDSIRFTLDIKQAHRAGEDPIGFVNALAGKIDLVHINDYDEGCDCLLPTFGTYDLATLNKNLNNVGFCGNYIIEVYSHSYGDVDEIIESQNRLNKLFFERQDL